MTLALAMHPTVKPVTSQLNAILSSFPAPANSAARYFPFVTPQLGSSTSATNAQQAMPNDGQIEKIIINLDTAPGVGKNYAITLLKNGVATPLSVTIADANTRGEASAIVTFAKGDIFVWEITPTGTPDTTPVWTASAQIRELGQSMITGDSSTSLSTTATTYAPINGGLWSTTLPVYGTLFNTDGYLRPGSLRFNGSLSSGSCSFTLVRRRGGVDTDTSITVAAASNSTVNISGSDERVLAGDQFYWRSDKTGTIGTSRAYPSLVFIPDVAGEGVYSWTALNASTASTATLLYTPQGSGSTFSNVNGRHAEMPFNANQNKFRALRDTLPAAGAPVAQNSYSGGAAKSSVSFTDSSAQDLQDTSNQSISAGNRFGFTHQRTAGSGNQSAVPAMTCVMKAV